MKGKAAAAAPVFIYEEPVNTESKKRESPCKNTAGDLKKSKKLINVVDKENMVKVNVVQPPPSLYSEPKKIQISQDEKLMSGAPEGDLFDMVVFEDTELWPFASDSEATEEFSKSCKIHDEATIWADQYEAVVVIRRVVLHHPDVLNSNNSMLLNAAKSIIAGVESLRSCRVRSGIMGLRTLLQNCGTSLSAVHATRADQSGPESDPCTEVITSLLTKTGGGPKFISELALNSLLQQAVRGVPPLQLVRCLLPSISHRNPDIGANAILATVECIRKIDAVVLRDASEEGVQLLKESIQGLGLGINARRPKAKESAKTMLKELVATVGDAHFQVLLKAHLRESVVGEVQRSLSSGSGSSAATPSTPSPLVVRPGTASMSCGMPSGSTLAMSMSMKNTNKFVRKPLIHPSSASSNVGSSAVSKFKLHVMSTGGASSSVKCSTSEIDFDFVGPPVRIAPILDASATPAPTARSVPTTVDNAGTPVPALSMREHIMLMKKQQRLAQQQATPLSIQSEVVCLVEVSEEKQRKQGSKVQEELA
jgi:hypothetical protein